MIVYTSFFTLDPHSVFSLAEPSSALNLRAFACAIFDSMALIQQSPVWLLNALSKKGLL